MLIKMLIVYDVIYKVSWRYVHVQRVYDSRNLSMSASRQFDVLNTSKGVA